MLFTDKKVVSLFYLRAKSSKSYHLGQKMNFIKLFGVLYGWKAYNP